MTVLSGLEEDRCRRPVLSPRVGEGTQQQLVVALEGQCHERAAAELEPLGFELDQREVAEHPHHVAMLSPLVRECQPIKEGARRRRCRNRALITAAVTTAAAAAAICI